MFIGELVHLVEYYVVNVLEYTCTAVESVRVSCTYIHTGELMQLATIP